MLSLHVALRAKNREREHSRIISFIWRTQHTSSCSAHTVYKAQKSTLIAALKQCTKKTDLKGGKKLHSDAVAVGCHTDKYVASALIKMYINCRSMHCAKEVFDSPIERDVVTWTCLILGYVENGESSKAMDLFKSMDCEPDHVTYIGALKACASLATERVSEKQVLLEKGIVIHKQLKKRGYDDIFVANTLLDMYGKCGSMHHARDIFERMTHKDVVTWNCLILGYVENGESLVAMDLFTRMNLEPSHITYTAALKACASLASERVSEKQSVLEKGMAIHKQVKSRGYDSDIVLVNTLIDMYGKCGSMQHARDLFDGMVHKDVVTWNCLVLGYVENGENSVAMDLFQKMDCAPSHVTYMAVLKACTASAMLEKGIAIHRQLKDRGFESNIVVASALLEMYSNCRSIQRAREVFDGMTRKDVISWTSLIMGYVENGESSVALDLFFQMDCEPSRVTYAAVLKASADLVAQPAGQLIHAGICKLGLEQDHVVATALVDSYGKCGSMSVAEEVFNSMHTPSIVSWNALITAYSSLGDSAQVSHVAKCIQDTGLQMDGVTFTCILTALSRLGMVEEGKKYFEYMHTHDMRPSLEHYTCMVDMLGRANKLEEALSVIKRMHFTPDVVMWRTLLGACRKWKNLRVGKVAYDALMEHNTKDASAYLLMGDIYASLEDREPIMLKEMGE